MPMFSFHHKTQFNRRWLQWSAVVLLAQLLIGLIIVMVLNTKIVNHIITPIVQFIGIFQIIWPEHPLDSLHFLATKSLFVFAHRDPRSGLNLWTIEYDTYTLLIYTGLSLIMGWVIARYRQQAISIPPGPFIACTAGIFFTALSVSYMTAIDHCSGATWMGFVALYGMGFNEFQLYPVYQIICAAIGIAGLGGGLTWLRFTKNRVLAWT
ncbi:MAG TPA: hypothetical protein VIM41_03535 [Gammaproteobacteria bacterium]